jgi:putative hydrolase of HD superfamily
MSAHRLERQLEFLLEADRLKQVERRTRIVGGRRLENSAEHSWHLALFALMLVEHADEAVDIARVVSMLLLHDLVEIDAGDTFAYDVDGHADKEAREQAAADRLFGLLPDDQGAWARQLWDEFEACSTAEARFALALDRLQPVLLNHANGGGPWREHGISKDRVLHRNGVVADASQLLMMIVRARVDELDQAGNFTDGAV